MRPEGPLPVTSTTRGSGAATATPRAVGVAYLIEPPERLSMKGRTSGHTGKAESHGNGSRLLEQESRCSGENWPTADRTPQR